MTEYTEQEALNAMWSLGVGKLKDKNNIIVIQYPKRPIHISEESSRPFLKNIKEFSYTNLVAVLVANNQRVVANMVMEAANIVLVDGCYDKI